MRRRQFITLVGGAAASWPLAARAQQRATKRIGVLTTIAAEGPEAQARLTAFVQGLMDWTVGQNARIDYRWGGGNADAMRKYAAEFVALAPHHFGGWEPGRGDSPSGGHQRANRIRGDHRSGRLF